MARVTLRIIDGSDRGRVFENIDTPITIGREEGNTIQLNDDRVSRFHIKLQEDHDKVVLTDLESTNGTKVNGEETHLRILKFGDMINVGRSLILFGSRDQIAARLANLRGLDIPLDYSFDEDAEEQLRAAVSLDFELNWRDDLDLQSTLHALEPPELPGRLDAVQAAQLSEVIEYVHLRLRALISSAHIENDDSKVQLDQRPWQGLLDLQSRLASYLRSIGDPNGPANDPADE
jgi:pSer/pThr/pTyr-binding forkhead associated (FHA) protein